MSNFLKEINEMGRYSELTTGEWRDELGFNRANNGNVALVIPKSDLIDLIAIKNNFIEINKVGAKTRFYKYLSEKYDRHPTTVAKAFKKAMRGYIL